MIIRVALIERLECYTKDVIEKLVERNKEVFLMTGLKWFAGGKERREQAVAIIDEVIETIGDKPNYADLKQVLHSYRTELADSRSATPYILSRMSLEISEVVRKDQLTLSPFIEERMAELRKLLAIRYGY